MVKKSEYRDLFPGALELMILETLNRKPMHGYAWIPARRAAATSPMEALRNE
jgi:hypothetical protein